MNKELTVSALELLQDEQMEFFSNIESYAQWLMNKVDFKNVMVMLNALNNQIDGTVYATDKVYFIADENNIYMDIENYFEQLEFHDDIWL